jgi:hypothetical protein
MLDNANWYRQHDGLRKRPWCASIAATGESLMDLARSYGVTHPAIMLVLKKAAAA